MVGLFCIGTLIIVFGGILAVWLYHDVEDGGVGSYRKTAVAALVISFLAGITCFWLCCLYDNMDEMALRISNRNFRCIDLPAEDFIKCGIDLSKDKPTIMRHYYTCSRSHNHYNEPCPKDKLCYKAYFVDSSNIDKYELLIKTTEKDN